MEREIGSHDGPRVGVFATCLVDLMRPVDQMFHANLDKRMIPQVAE